MHLEKIVIEGENRRAYIGQATAGILSVLGFASAAFFAELGHPVEGASVATGVIIGLAAVFLKGSANRRDERAEKARVMTGRQKPPGRNRQIPGPPTSP